MSSSVKPNSKLLHLVEEVEHEYRTVLQAPDDDENLRRLHSLGEKILKLQPEVADQQKAIISLLEEGYDAVQIGKRIGLSKRHVQRLLKKQRLKTKPNFTYKVINKYGDSLMFSNNLKSVFNYFGLNTHMSNKQKIVELRKNGLFIKSGKEKYCWHDVPKRALYYFHSDWYMKN